MNQQQQNRSVLFITHVDKEGPFLKISAQFDRKTSTYIEQILLNAQQQFNNGLFIPAPETLQSGMLCSVKYRDNKYYRCCITTLNYIKNHYVEVNFIDYGFCDLVPINHIRSLESFENSFTSIPAQAISYLLAEAVSTRGEWNDMILTQIAEEIRFIEVNCNIVAQIGDYYLARFFHGQLDLTVSLIIRGLMRHTSLQTQEAVLLSMLPNKKTYQQSSTTTTTLPPPTPTQNIVTYKAFSLESGQQYPVYVSYVQDGPCNFSVQLQQSEDALCKLMKEINSMPLTPLDGIPIPGTVCLARCIEDGHICRAVVTNEVDGNFKVFYVDFGNFEIVSLDALYEIPFKCVIPKVMAIRFCLAGIEKQSVTLEMQCAFKEFVDNRLIHMKVLPMTTRTSLPKCELWDPVTKINALDVINEAAAIAYPEQIQLTRGYTQLVKVCYVYSCNRLYVQLKMKENDLNNLMSDIQQICQSNNQQLNDDQIKIGLPCYALYENDQQWYRSQIIDIIDNDKVIVHYVDYGNDETIKRSLLKPIDGKQLIRLYPQAIECCLNGYQNMSVDLERDHLLEELIFEKEFTMKVIEMFNNRALIELIDSSNYNVASLLLERIAVSKSQISPLLVHADYKIEHRKSQQTQQQSQQHRLHRNSDASGNEQQNSWENTTNKRDYNESIKTGNNYNNNSNWRTPMSDNKTRYDNTNRKMKRDDRFNNVNRNDDQQQSNDESWRSNNRSNNRTNKRNPNLNSSNDSDSSVQNRLRSRDNKFNKHNDDWSNGDINNREKKNSFSQFSPSNKSRDRDSRPKRDNFNSRRESSDMMSSSGSEKSFRKNSSNNRNNRNDNMKNQQQQQQRHRSGGLNFKKFEKSPSPNFTNNYSNNSNNNRDCLSPQTVLKDIATENDQYNLQQLKDENTDIIISWFHNPNNFYCQLLEKQEEFKQLMKDIQETYKDLKNSRKIESQQIGTPIIGLFPDDGVLYRGKIIDKIGFNQYKIFYIDFGNVSIIEQIYPIEKRLMELPAQAIQCSLFNIDSINDNWLDANNYAPYFNRKQFKCKHISTKNNKNFIELFDGTVNIGELLINDGLARIQSIPIDLDLLKKQRFRAKIIKINNLNDFTIITRQFERILNCSIYNPDTGVDSNILFDNLGKTCIVLVNQIVDNRLEVTLYNNEGEKLKLSIDENDEKIDRILPYFLTQSKRIGYIVHTDQEKNLNYLQLQESDEDVKVLLNNLYEYYQNTNNNEIKYELNRIYAVLSSDTNWYRGRLIQINDDKTILINFIDYGNSEIVPNDNLKELLTEFIEPHTFCIPVQFKTLSDDLLEQHLNLELKPTDCGFYNATIITETDNVIEQQTIEVIKDIVEEEDNIVVLISHIDSPNDFYIQLEKSLDDIEKLQKQLQDEIDTMPDLENPTIGVLCAAPYSLDQQWYRAQVLDADSDITTVRFIDYGNTDVINNQTNKIKQLPANLLQLAVYATRCSLNILPINESEWNTEIIKYFEELTTTQNHLICKFLQQDEKINYIELYDDQKRNITEILINENFGKSNDLITQKTTNINGNIGYVSHLNSPSEFWIQLENCIDELEWIAEQLSQAQDFLELQDLSPGILCAALFPDDQMWYRARILSNTIAGIEVLFIDYGNSCSITMDSLRELPEDLLMLPPQAQKCCLRKPDGLTNWSPEMCNRFHVISADGQATFTVKKIGTGETSLVELLLDGEDVIKLLLPTTESVIVKSFTNLEDLVLLRNGVEIEKKFKLKSLPDLEWDQESLEKFSEIVNNGGQFQAEFFESDPDVVVLYRDLNDIRLELNGVRKVSATSSPIKIRTELNEETNPESCDKIEVVEDTEAEIVVEANSEIIEDKMENSPYEDVTETIESTTEIKVAPETAVETDRGPSPETTDDPINQDSKLEIEDTPEIAAKTDRGPSPETGDSPINRDNEPEIEATSEVAAKTDRGPSPETADSPIKPEIEATPEIVAETDQVSPAPNQSSKDQDTSTDLEEVPESTAIIEVDSPTKVVSDSAKECDKTVPLSPENKGSDGKVAGDTDNDSTVCDKLEKVEN